MIDEAVRVTVVGGIDALRPAVRRACDAAAALDVPPRRLDDVRLAVHELILNAVEHGHGGDPQLPIDVEVSGSGTEVRVRVTDRGVGTDPAVASSEWAVGVAWAAEVGAGSEARGGSGELSERGHGLRLVAGLVDGLEVDVGPARTTVTVVFDTAPR